MPLSFYITVGCINGLWLVFMLVWLVFAFRVKSAVYRQPLRQRYVFLALIVAGVVFMQRLPGTRTWLFRPALWNEALGVGLCAAGIAWAIWARVHLGRNWSGFVTIKKDHELIQTGPYRITRHPIYSGLLPAILGTVLALTPSVGGLISMVLVTIGFTVKLRQEEAAMTRQFPEAYPAYKKRVRAALVPFLF